jgi:hypothetical protein
MTALTLELSPDLYARLRAEAERVGKRPEGVAQEWLTERLVAPAPASNRERARAALRAGGLLVEDPLGPAMRRRVEGAKITLEEVSADLARAGGQPLSEIVLAQRGPKA